MATIKTERWLNTAEAAAELGRKPATLVVWRWEGRGPEYFDSGRIRYRIEDVHAWEAAETERRCSRRRKVAERSEAAAA